MHYDLGRLKKNAQMQVQKKCTDAFTIISIMCIYRIDNVNFNLTDWHCSTFEDYVFKKIRSDIIHFQY